MAFNATFFNFQKRVNSTKKPGAGGTTYNIILKDTSSIVTPDIALDIGQDGNPSLYNYCFIPAFNRYYWVEDWVWINRLWHARCKIDALASHKESIGSYQAYVARSSAEYDGDIIDRYYPALADVTEVVENATVHPTFTQDVNSGTFVIGVMGKNAGQNGGAVTYYAVKPAAIQAITNYLMDIQNVTVSDISDDLLKIIFNPMQYIVSCMWYPFAMIMSTDPIEVGWWEITGVGTGNSKVLSEAVYTSNLSYKIPKHPQAASRGNYLNMPPFSRYILNAGPWGAIALDNTHLLKETKLVCVMHVDLYTGSGRLSIVGKDNLAYIEDHAAQIGVPIQLGQNMLNQGALMNATTGTIGVGVNAALGNPMGMLSDGLKAIGSAAELSQPVPSTVGSNGSFDFNIAFNMIGRFLKVADEDNSSRGRPLCKKKTINTLPGYIQCIDADPPISCTAAELSSIVSYMNSGFYYE